MAFQLIDENGTLAFPFEGETRYFVVRYPEGDCDLISWPLTEEDKERLPRELFDLREMGILKDGEEVILPNGEQITF